jgi:hypothetical protein
MSDHELINSCRRLEQALESVDDVITLLDWHYADEAHSSIAKLEAMRADIKIGLALASVDTPLH